MPTIVLISNEQKSVQFPSSTTVSAAVLAGAIVGGIRGIHTDFYRIGLLLVDPYWTQFYTTTYQDHFRRRALIGTLCRLIWPQGVSVIAINAIALATAGLLTFLLIRAFITLTRVRESSQALFAFAFFASTFGAMLFDCLGDPLQVAILIFCSLLALASRKLVPPSGRMLIGLCATTAAFFVHEASLFLLAPAIPFFTERRPHLKNFFAPLMLLLSLLLLSLHWSKLHPVPTYHAITFPHMHAYSERADTPDFKTLLHEEGYLYFGSPQRGLRFVAKCLRVALLLLAGLIAVSVCFSAMAFRRFLVTLAVILLLGSPLWIVALDWGRFLSYTFFLAIVSTSAWHQSHDEGGDDKPGRAARFVETFNHFSDVGMVRLSCLMVLLATTVAADRETGSSVRELISILVLAGLAFFLPDFLVRPSHPSDHS